MRPLNFYRTLCKQSSSDFGINESVLTSGFIGKDEGSL